MVPICGAMMRTLPAGPLGAARRCCTGFCEGPGVTISGLWISSLGADIRGLDADVLNFAVAVSASRRGRQGVAGGAWRPARARWPCGGPRRGSLGVYPGVLAWRRYSRWGSDVGGVKGGGHRPDALGDRPTAAIPIVRVRRRRKPLGGRRTAAPRRCSERCPKSSPAAACVGLIASRSPLQGRPGLGYRADVPICVPMPGDMGTGNIGTRALCAAITRAASRATGQPLARGPANQPAGRSEGPPGHAGPRRRGQQGAQRVTARCSMRPAPLPRSPCRTARPAGGRQ